MIRRFLLLTALILLSCMGPYFSQAQTTDPFGNPISAPPPPPPVPIDTPIDGGVTLLIGAGIVYGIKNAREKRKMKREKNVEGL